jgi:hypothetical protein
MTYRWEAEHVAHRLPVRREMRRVGETWWGPSLLGAMRGESGTAAGAARQLVTYGFSGQRYRMVRSDGEVVLTVEPGWRKW